MERDDDMLTCVFEVINFNSHAHVERDEMPDKLHPLQGISTHTLTWSVTVTPEESRDLVNISTHTLTWSVT